MKNLVIYDSSFGNTEKIARAIAEVLASNGETRLIRVSEANVSDLESVKLLVVGSPTQGGMPTKALQYFLNKLPANILKDVKVAAFDTRFSEKDQSFALRLLMKVIQYAAPRIAVSLKNKGGKLVAEPEGFIVDDKEGPLRQDELERASGWVRKIASC